MFPSIFCVRILFTYARSQNTFTDYVRAGRQLTFSQLTVERLLCRLPCRRLYWFVCLIVYFRLVERTWKNLTWFTKLWMFFFKASRPRCREYLYATAWVALSWSCNLVGIANYQSVVGCFRGQHRDHGTDVSYTRAAYTSRNIAKIVQCLGSGRPTRTGSRFVVFWLGWTDPQWPPSGSGSVLSTGWASRGASSEAPGQSRPPPAGVGSGVNLGLTQHMIRFCPVISLRSSLLR